MPANKTLTAQKHERIRSRFRTLSKISTKNGKKKYTYAAIIEMLGKEFFLAEYTIERIIVA